MSNGWGTLSWSDGEWGLQGNVNVPVNGGVDTGWGIDSFGEDHFGGLNGNLDITLGSVTATGIIAAGWGSNEWGQYYWGITGDIVVVTGSQLNAATHPVDIKIDGNISVNVDEDDDITITTGNIVINADCNINITGSRLNTFIGNEIVSADVSLTVSGQQLNINLGNVEIDAQVREGWGVYQWGIVPWGGEQDPEVNVIGSALEVVTHPVDIQIDDNISVNVDEDDDITIAVGSPTIRTDVTFNVTGSRLNVSEGLASVLIIIDTSVSVTGNQVNLDVGQAEAFQETLVPVTTAGRLNVLIGNESTTADANVFVTGSQLNGSLGQIKYEVTYSVTGSQANLSVGTVTFVITGSTTVTGSRLNISEGSVNIQGWSEVQTGANNNWTPVDIAA